MGATDIIFQTWTDSISLGESSTVKTGLSRTPCFTSIETCQIAIPPRSPLTPLLCMLTLYNILTAVHRFFLTCGYMLQVLTNTV